MEKISPELNYQTGVASHSTPVFRDVSPQGTSSATLSATSTVGPYEMLINPAVFNLAKSKLCFRLNVAAQGANNYSHIVDGGLSKISRIVLYDTATNAIWADINNVHQFASQIRGATKLTDLTTKNTYVGAVKTSVADADKYPLEDMRPTKAATGSDISGATFGAENPYTSPKYVASSAVNAASVYRYEVPLGALKFSAFDTNKMIYNPSNLTLQVYWNNTNSFGCQGTDATDPSTGATALTGAITVDDIKLRLYNEGNLSVVSQVIDKVMSSGLEMPIVYPTITRQTLASSTAHSYQLNLSSGYGQRILGVLTSPFSVVAFQSTKNELGNITSYNTFLDNVAIKFPSNINAAKGEHWSIANGVHFEESAIQSGAQYDEDFVHVDSFFGPKPLWAVDNSVDGFDVSGKMATWAINATLSGATSYVYVSTILGQKMLSLSSAGSAVV